MEVTKLLKTFGSYWNDPIIVMIPPTQCDKVVTFTTAVKKGLKWHENEWMTELIELFL